MELTALCSADHDAGLPAGGAGHNHGSQGDQGQDQDQHGGAVGGFALDAPTQAGGHRRTLASQLGGGDGSGWPRARWLTTSPGLGICFCCGLGFGYSGKRLCLCPWINALGGDRLRGQVFNPLDELQQLLEEKQVAKAE